MKLVIQSEKDARSLVGKFVLQVNSNEPDKTLMDMSWGFAKEKRLKIVIPNGFFDLYGWVTTYDTFEDFKDVFNDYYTPGMKEGKYIPDPGRGHRFHRLLNLKELEYLFEKIKEDSLK